MHVFEYFLVLDCDFQADFFAFFLELFAELLKGKGAFARVHEKYHREHVVHHGLAEILDVDLVFRKHF